MEIKRKLTNGFTLLEILITILLFAVLGTIASQTLFALFKGATKVETMKEVKQNGDYALSVMEYTLRNASSATIVGNTIQLNGTTDGFGCTVVAGINHLTQIRSGGTSLLTNDKVNVVNCSGIFSVTPASPLMPQVVTINFTLRQAQTVSRPEEQATQVFHTQINLRNK